MANNEASGLVDILHDYAKAICGHGRRRFRSCRSSRGDRRSAAASHSLFWRSFPRLRASGCERARDLEKTNLCQNAAPTAPSTLLSDEAVCAPILVAEVY